ncbi:hypothetical protein [Nereida sp. MMG025]|uniref:hypothetical protein n=1 Tax=Nereida sp. MMG025 TaxID=2909981 RepID=UPI001F42EA74|nr:hypothetical protein [Nereida sp. MMG025]MCF6445020.1 hypothetical protein [Nereida sp. MMG025]
MLYWQLILRAHDVAVDKPQVHIILPDKYCGEFVVFWGENSAPVEEPPEFLSYNILPDMPNAVLINLPSPYTRADLRFVHLPNGETLRRNPLFRLTGVIAVRLNSGVETLENGDTRSLPGIETGVQADIFTIGPDCDSDAPLGGNDISALYLSISRTSGE